MEGGMSDERHELEYPLASYAIWLLMLFAALAGFAAAVRETYLAFQNGEVTRGILMGVASALMLKALMWLLEPVSIRRHE
jgi:uncharacterized membrane protein (DUF485 family)